MKSSRENRSGFPDQGNNITVHCGAGKTQNMSRQALQSWLKTVFCREGQGRGAKAGETVWDLMGWVLEGQIEAGRNGTPLTICENREELFFVCLVFYFREEF